MWGERERKSHSFLEQLCHKHEAQGTWELSAQRESRDNPEGGKISTYEEKKTLHTHIYTHTLAEGNKFRGGRMVTIEMAGLVSCCSLVSPNEGDDLKKKKRKTHTKEPKKTEKVRVQEWIRWRNWNRKH